MYTGDDKSTESLDKVARKRCRLALDAINTLAKASKSTIYCIKSNSNYRPWSIEDYRVRLLSFKESDWIKRPWECGAPEAARYGWILDAGNALKCVQCDARIYLPWLDDMEVDTNNMIYSVERNLGKIADQFRWRANLWLPAIDKLPDLLIPTDLGDSDNLFKLIVDKDQDDHPTNPGIRSAVLLAVFGWMPSHTRPLSAECSFGCISVPLESIEIFDPKYEHYWFCPWILERPDRKPNYSQVWHALQTQDTDKTKPLPDLKGVLSPYVQKEIDYISWMDDVEGNDAEALLPGPNYNEWWTTHQKTQLHKALQKYGPKRPAMIAKAAGVRKSELAVRCYLARLKQASEEHGNLEMGPTSKIAKVTEEEELAKEECLAEEACRKEEAEILRQHSLKPRLLPFRPRELFHHDRLALLTKHRMSDSTAVLLPGATIGLYRSLCEFLYKCIAEIDAIDGELHRTVFPPKSLTFQRRTVDADAVRAVAETLRYKLATVEQIQDLAQFLGQNGFVDLDQVPLPLHSGDEAAPSSGTRKTRKKKHKAVHYSYFSGESTSRFDLYAGKGNAEEYSGLIGRSQFAGKESETSSSLESETEVANVFPDVPSGNHPLPISASPSTTTAPIPLAVPMLDREESRPPADLTQIHESSQSQQSSQRKPQRRKGF